MWLSYFVIWTEFVFFSSGQWFELTPQEAGFPELGLFVETCLLGSRFKDGELLQKRSEIDMVELQGAVIMMLRNKQFC